MENNYFYISQEIIDKKETLARQLITYHFDKLEKKKSERIEYIKQKTKEDIYYNIIHLSEAIRYGSKNLFFNYIGWLKTLLKYYGVSIDDLIEHFEVFKNVVSQNFDIESTNTINSFLDEGLDALRKVEITESSYLNENNKHYDIAKAYIEAILATEKNRAIDIILSSAKNGVPIEEIYLDIFQPVQYQIGWLWQTNKISVGQEHYAMAITQLVMSQLYPFIFNHEKKSYRFVACGVSEELHELGIRMVADIFELNGWDTYFLGANTPAESVVKLVEEKDIQVLALSATILYHLKKVEDFIKTIKNSLRKIPKIIVGGYAFEADSGIWEKVGADAYAKDPHTALNIAKNLITN